MRGDSKELGSTPTWAVNARTGARTRNGTWLIWGTNVARGLTVGWDFFWPKVLNLGAMLTSSGPIVSSTRTSSIQHELADCYLEPDSTELICFVRDHVAVNGLIDEQICSTEGELDLVHQGVHCEHSSDKVNKDLHEGKVAVCHHLLQHWATKEPELDLVDQPSANRDAVPIALNQVRILVWPRMLYLNVGMLWLVLNLFKAASSWTSS
ncbi:hypothetical protein Acr_27g0000780 [Actinidia rufa]|uniref:Uncharacterized protein n=1 Tax=Actinidia rufa TaxID=165716 RepID=A0A7J0H5K8_9ERIC|nr:hypothetical protein Acr_27g0000780 [Actinidia rufa]